MTDPISEFYDTHPYPPPVEDLSGYADLWRDPDRRRVEHHLRWPTVAYRDDQSVLVAGCGTSQAARYAIRHPGARVVGIDVSPASLAHTRTLIERHELDNLELIQMGVEEAPSLDESFAEVVCTGVLHHLADPAAGLQALRGVLAPSGVMHLMVYAPYGRTGVYMIQDYCRRLGVANSPAEIADLVASLRELPMGHPLSHLLRNTPDFHDDDALADALLNPRDCSYSVPEVLDLVTGAGLRFGRWLRQAPYLPTCGALATVPHGERIAEFSPSEQFAAVELFRGTMTRHSMLLGRDDDVCDAQPIRFDSDAWRRYIPLRQGTAVVVEERLPEGAAAALLNTAHAERDLVLFVSPEQRRVFESVDGRQAIAEIPGADPDFFRLLWEHDLVVFEAT